MQLRGVWLKPNFTFNNNQSSVRTFCSFHQGNIDGSNPKQRQAWLWVAVTPLVTVFEIALTRCTQAAQTLLGENFAGMLNSDRHGAYNWVDLARRQLCWAHLRREFIKISERSGVSQELGTALVKHQEKLFELWHRVRDGTLAWCDFVELAQEIRLDIKTLLQEAAAHAIGAKEKTPLAQTVRTCRQLLKVEPAMWLFVTTEGVEPTNNAAERAIRPAVRKATYQFWDSNPSWQCFCRPHADRRHHSEVSTPQCAGIFHLRHCRRS